MAIALKTFSSYVLCLNYESVSSKKIEVKSTTLLEKGFIDILGALNPPSVHGVRYVLMIIDEYSKFKVVIFLRAKTEALEKIQDFIAEHTIPRVLRSDNGKEYQQAF